MTQNVLGCVGGGEERQSVTMCRQRYIDWHAPMTPLDL